MQFTVKRAADGAVTVEGWEAIPCRLSSVTAYNDFCPTPYEEGSEEYDRTMSKLDGSFDGPNLVIDYSEYEEEDDSGEVTGRKTRPAPLSSRSRRTCKLSRKETVQLKSNRPYPAVTVSAKAERSLRNGHPWVYAEEIRERTGELTPGGITDVFAAKGAWLGAGIYSPASKIAVRILSDNANETFSDAFFERRVKYALEYRRTVMGEDFNACRLVFGEADGLPGVTVDRFEDVLVTQIMSLGMGSSARTCSTAPW